MVGFLEDRFFCSTSLFCHDKHPQPLAVSLVVCVTLKTPPGEAGYSKNVIFFKTGHVSKGFHLINTDCIPTSGKRVVFLNLPGGDKL